MKLMTSFLAVAMMAGGAWAQNPNIINNVQNKMDAVQQQKTDDSNAALDAAGVPATQPAKKPSAAEAPSSASAMKPAAAPSGKQLSSQSAKPVAAATSNKNSNNLLEHVNVAQQGDGVQIEINSREAVTPKVSKLTSPDRLLVELPGTAMATSQSKIAVGANGIKGVRIGMNSKTPPTTSLVVDLDKACAYEITPGAGNQLILKLHTQGMAKNAPPTPRSASVAVTAKVSAPQVKTQTAVANPGVAPAATAKPVKLAVATTAPKVVKPAPVPAPKDSKAAIAVAARKATAKLDAAPKLKTVAVKPALPSTKIVAVEPAPAVASADAAKAPEEKKPEEKKWAMTGRRDPFFSPVVQQSTGSGCSTGKKCLEIGQINVRGVVKSDGGFIAVVTNGLNKAYFLHENDPVFNGYVVRITGDSVVFQETVQDKLGKPFTREIVKKITTPAV